MTIEMEYANIIENFKREYINLIEEFLRISKPRINVTSNNFLDDLKKDYSSLIKSARTADYIENIEGLLRVLEKRNALSYDNIALLIDIESRYLQVPELSILLKNYEKRMNDRPVVPLFNIYDLPSGKYIVERNIMRNKRLVFTLETANNDVQTCTKHEQIIYPNDTNNHDNLEISTRLQPSQEDTLFNETEIFLRNNVETIVEPRINYNLGDCCMIFIAKTRKTFFKRNTVTITISFLVATVIMIFLINACDVWPVSRYEPQPGISRHSTSNNEGSQRHQIRAQMTLYNDTEPRFHITLPGSVGISQNEQSSREEDTDIARSVLLEVSEKLGRHWRDVARFLGVTEYDIDEIDYHSQLSMKEKAFKALLKFQSKSDPSQWKSKLQRALEKARRRDLMEMVEELSTRKYPST